jgi:peptidoglycan endopeptidase LytE
VSSAWINYTVQSGESLWAIANRFGTKVEIIKRTNELETEVLSPGKVLKVFAKTDKITDSPNIEIIPKDVPIVPRPVNYTVLKGETLTVISKKFNTTPDAIMKLNGITSPNIREGQVLKVLSNK